MTTKPKGKPARPLHPLLEGRPTNIWWEDCVGVVPYYPRTEAAFNRRHRLPPPPPAEPAEPSAVVQSRGMTLAMRNRLRLVEAIIDGCRDGQKG